MPEERGDREARYRLLGVVPREAEVRRKQDPDGSAFTWPHMIVRHVVVGAATVAVVFALAILFNAPLKDIANAKTPTLLFVGENDERVPKAQSIEMFQALKSNGVPTHLYVAPRDGHQWQELRHQLFKANAELEWFERHARGRAYTWERAPE